MPLRNRRKPLQGRPDPRLILVRRQSGYNIRRRLLPVLAFCLGATVVVLAIQLFPEQVIDAAWQQEYLNIKDENKKLKAALSGASSVSDDPGPADLIEERALEKIRQENLALQRRISELETELSLYRSVLSPGESDKKGLQVERFDLYPTDVAGRFRYRLVLIQAGEARDLIEGLFDIHVIGLLDGEPHELKLPIPASSESEPGNRFRFRYLHRVESDLVLADGFLPENVVIKAKTIGRKPELVERQFVWRINL
jgi:hypothetical protein